METKTKSLKLALATFIMFLMVSCNSEGSIDVEKVFDTANQGDSLKYYFPSSLNDTVRPDDSPYKDFTQKRYSAILYAFKEPILSSKRDLQNIYRLLWVRSFNEPVCFIFKEENEKFYLRSKVLNTYPSFLPDIADIERSDDQAPIIIYDSLITLKKSEWDVLEGLLKKISFWDGPLKDPNDLSSTDGANWIIEGRKHGKYHFIDRRNDTGEMIPLGKYLIELSGLKIEEKFIY